MDNCYKGGGEWSFDLFNRSYARDMNKTFQLMDAKKKFLNLYFYSYILH